MECPAASIAVKGIASESYDGASPAHTLSIGAAIVATPSTTELPIDIACSLCGVTMRTSVFAPEGSEPDVEAQPGTAAAHTVKTRANKKGVGWFTPPI